MERSLYKQRAAGVFEQKLISCTSRSSSTRRFSMAEGRPTFSIPLVPPSAHGGSQLSHLSSCLDTCAKNAGAQWRNIRRVQALKQPPGGGLESSPLRIEQLFQVKNANSINWDTRATYSTYYTPNF